MARCAACGVEMESGQGCQVTQLTIDRRVLERVPLGSEGEEWWLGTEPPRSCHDCGVTTGGIHHVMCDMEMCPACGEQLLGCGCELDGAD